MNEQQAIDFATEHGVAVSTTRKTKQADTFKVGSFELKDRYRAYPENDRRRLRDMAVIDRAVALLNADTLAAAQSGQRAGAAKGWKLVPVEPTDEMVRAGNDLPRYATPARHVWEAMLAAAPTQQDGSHG